MATITIGAGQTSSGLSVAVGSPLLVTSGGVIENTTVNDGLITVATGGNAFGTKVTGGNGC